MGTILKSVEVPHGSNAIAPDAPQREGYTFIGWDKEYNNITENLVITAQYQINKYTVSFVADGQVIAAIEKEYGQTLTQADYPTVPERLAMLALGNK